MDALCTYCGEPCPAPLTHVDAHHPACEEAYFGDIAAHEYMDRECPQDIDTLIDQRRDDRLMRDEG